MFFCIHHNLCVKHIQIWKNYTAKWNVFDVEAPGKDFRMTLGDFFVFSLYLHWIFIANVNEEKNANPPRQPLCLV